MMIDDESWDRDVPAVSSETVVCCIGFVVIVEEKGCAVFVGGESVAKADDSPYR